MTNDAAWLRAMANTMRRIAVAREEAGAVELAGELKGLALFVQAAALMCEDDDQFRAEQPTAPQTVRERTRVGVAAPIRARGLR